MPVNWSSLREFLLDSSDPAVNTVKHSIHSSKGNQGKLYCDDQRYSKNYHLYLSSFSKYKLQSASQGSTIEATSHKTRKHSLVCVKKK